MAGYLIAEEGPLSGLLISFEEGNEWILGRDPDETDIVLEDPMVSRKHVVCRLTPEGFVLENLSSVNPATQNGKVITEAILLREGDIIQIGNTFFRFTLKAPSVQESPAEELPAAIEVGDLSNLSFEMSPDIRWLLKVISGPNAGAEFGMRKGSTYVIGKDPNLCDIIFQDLSVSRQHARLSVDEQNLVFIEDLGSRNGVLVNGELISDKHLISSQDLISLGTTTFLIIDKEQVRETIVSPPTALPYKTEVAKEELLTAESAVAARTAGPMRDWKEMIIPIRHLIFAGVFGLVLIGSIAALFALFNTKPVVLHGKNENERIQEIVKDHPDIQFTYNGTNGKLFLTGHVLTSIEKQELIYTLKTLAYIESIDDTVVIDEYVWQNMNALLITNPQWQGVTIQSLAPGRFVIRGYLKTNEEAQTLADYINVNFPYLDRLQNEVVVENNLILQIQNALIEKGFSSVTFELSNGELILNGRVDAKRESAFNETIEHFKTLRGVRVLKNFVILTSEDSSRIDLTTQYKITGYSKRDDLEHYVVVNGRILAKGDSLDGMMITSVQSNIVLLEKDGLKFKINYNLQ